MRIAAALALVFSLAHPAAVRADDCTPGDCSLAELFAPRPKDWLWHLHAGLRTDGRKSSGGDQRIAALAAGFEVSYGSDECRYAGLAADVSGYADRGGRSLSGYEALTFCVPIPIHLTQITLRRERDLIPRLSAPPYYRASRYGSAGGVLEMRLLRFSGDTVDVRVGRVRLDLSFVTQDAGGGTSRTSDSELAFSMVQIAWPGRGFLGAERVIDIMATRIAGRGTQDEPQDGGGTQPDDDMRPTATAIAFSPVRLSGLGGRGYRLDLDVGFALGQFAEVGPWIEHPDGTIEENVDVASSLITPHVDVTLQWGDARRSQGIELAHTLAPSSYRALVVDDRASAWLQLGADRASTTARGFAALTRIVYDDGQVERVATGGVALSRHMLVGDHARLGLTGELARSFYADLHGLARVDAGWAARIQAEIALFARSGE